MKNLAFISIGILMNINCSFSQLTLDHVYTTDAPYSAFKLSSSGLKYYADHSITPGGSVDYFVLYNPDHSVFRTINVPQISGKKAQFISFVSDALFDLDTLIEYMLFYHDNSSQVNGVSVLNENGNVLLSLDSAVFGAGTLTDVYRGFINTPIFPDGNQTKLYLGRGYSNPRTTNVYSLPGQLVCLECSGGLVSGLAQPPNLLSDENKSLAYPNPATDYIRIKYFLPTAFKHAFVNLYDITGKLIKQKQIDKHYDDIYISTEEIKQGVYSYDIVVDDKRLSSGKIVKL